MTTRTLAVVSAGLSVPSSTRLLADRLTAATVEALRERGVSTTVEVVELSITAERTVDKEDKCHSEFFYGSFARTVRLPAGADTKKVTASYDAGILQVTVPVHAPAEARKVPVHITKN